MKNTLPDWSGMSVAGLKAALDIVITRGYVVVVDILFFLCFEAECCLNVFVETVFDE